MTVVSAGRPRRLFVAVDVPSAPLAPVLATLSDRGLRTVAPERVHLTLAFMGAVPDAAVPDLQDALVAVAAARSPFTLRFSGEVGRFGRAVAWAGLDESAALDELAHAVRGAVRRAGVATDDKPFRAHVTLARGGRRGVRRHDVEGREVQTSAWRVDRARLMESHLGGGPARWLTVREMPLTADA